MCIYTIAREIAINNRRTGEPSTKAPTAVGGSNVYGSVKAKGNAKARAKAKAKANKELTRGIQRIISRTS